MCGRMGGCCSIRLQGKARLGKRTKELLLRMQPRDIAFIDHSDLDEVSACGLLEREALAVVNASSFLTGHYPASGARILCDAGVLLLEVDDPKVFERIEDGEIIELRFDTIYVRGQPLFRGRLITSADLQERYCRARENEAQKLDEFLRNTLEYLQEEQSWIHRRFRLPKIPVTLQGRQVLVVVRGTSYKADLRAITTYIRDHRPVLIGVDGGADALLEHGLRPDLIIGDMDSVSDRALRMARARLVQAYPWGEAPGKQRLEQLNLDFEILDLPGTSEDAALLLAGEAGAELIIAVGTHTHPVEFWEKGRGGMSSTLLVRWRLGGRLIDAKGIGRLYQPRPRLSDVVSLMFVGLLPLAIVASSAPAARSLLHLWWLQFRLSLGW